MLHGMTFYLELSTLMQPLAENSSRVTKAFAMLLDKNFYLNEFLKIKERTHDFLFQYSCIMGVNNLGLLL